MVVVPFFLELASDEQWQQVEKALHELGVCFFTRERLTLEGVEKHFKGHSREAESHRKQLAPCKHDHLNMDGICHACGEDKRGI